MKGNFEAILAINRAIRALEGTRGEIIEDLKTKCFNGSMEELDKEYNKFEQEKGINNPMLDSRSYRTNQQ